MKLSGVSPAYALLACVLCFMLWGSQACAKGTMTITPLSDNVYLHVSYKYVDGFGLVPSNGLVVLMPEGSVLLDTPWTGEETQALLHWAKEQHMPITRSFSSHSHEDRTAGIAVLNAEGVNTFARQETNTILRAKGKTPALRTIEEDIFEIAPGIEVFYPGEGHAPDNSVVWLRESNILLGGCLIREAETDSLGYTGDANLKQWGPSVQRVIMRYPNVQLVLPGHGAPGDKRLLEHTVSLTTKTQ